MSYVVSIERVDGKPCLQPLEIERLLAEDESLSQQRSNLIIWNRPAGGRSHYLNFQDGRLWTDDLGSSGDNHFLEKLRCVAFALDARLRSEEREDMTDEAIPSWPKSGCAKAGVIALIAVPLAVLACR